MSLPDHAGPPAGCYTPGGFITVSFCWIAHMPAICVVYLYAGVFPLNTWYLSLPLMAAHTAVICLFAGFLLSGVWRLERLESRDVKWRAWRVIFAAQIPFVFFSGWWPYVLIPLWPWLLGSGMRLGYACWFKDYWRQLLGAEPPRVG